MLSKKRMEVAVKELQYNFDLLKDIIVVQQLQQNEG